MSDDLSQDTSSTDASSDDRNLAMLSHLLCIVLGFLAPLIIWLMNKDKTEKEFLNDQAKESLNFQITIFIAIFISSLLCFVLIGFVLLPIVSILDIVFCIIAGIAASKGTKYRYPLTLRLIG
jgi:uncharacterized Tic20 family protein